jgi:hypothetical protein
MGAAAGSLADVSSTFHCAIYSISIWCRMRPSISTTITISFKREIRRYNLLWGGCFNVDSDVDSVAYIS